MVVNLSSSCQQLVAKLSISCHLVCSCHKVNSFHEFAKMSPIVRTASTSYHCWMMFCSFLQNLCLFVFSSIFMNSKLACFVRERKTLTGRGSRKMLVCYVVHFTHNMFHQGQFFWFFCLRFFGKRREFAASKCRVSTKNPPAAEPGWCRSGQ